MEIEIGTDTLNLYELRNGIKKYIDIAYSIDSAYDVMYNKVMGIAHSNYSMKKIESNGNDKKNFIKALESMMQYSSCKIDTKIDLSLVKSKFDSIFTLDTIVVKDKIKCRVNDGGELRLKTYTSNRDTLFKNIVISSTGAKAEDIYDFYEESNRCLDFSEICQNK